MKQLLQNLRDGKTMVAEVPLPTPGRGTALVQTAASLVSAGTERTLVAFAEQSLLGKARSRPDLVRQVLDKARREGILPTIQATFNRLDQPMPLGYSSAGTIVNVGEGLEGFQIGDRVACAGGGHAVHAEYEVVPQNLLALLPSNVGFESAAFTTLGAIAMHGFRLAQPQLGERVAIIGLGLLGLLSVGIARAAGCHVFGVDLSPERVRLAQAAGAEAILRTDAESAGLSFSHGLGFDIVLICADSHSNDPIALAGNLSRDRGRVVAVGAVGLNIPRKVYYEKEISFLVSRSYGPGRYDLDYEEHGRDYPIGFVRWTEGRNLAAFVDLLAKKQVDVPALITHRYPIEQAGEAYDLITGKRHEPFLGVLITYPQKELGASASRVNNPNAQPHPSLNGQPAVSVLGAGSYATAVFLPVIQKTGGVRKVGIASGSGLSARNASMRYGFEYASSSEQDVMEDQNSNIIVILTRHQQHARQVLRALELGKHVFCEKPLAIHPAELDEIESRLAGNASLPLLMMGFNRRFAPLTRQLKDFLGKRSEPLFAHYRVNAGYLPLNHWLHDPQQGGGRIIGEGCHFVDYLTYLIGAPPIAVSAAALPDVGRYRQDNVNLQFTFPDGSIGTLDYLANGDKSFPKEQVEVFCAGKVGVLDDFRSLELITAGSHRKVRPPLGQDKGHRGGWEAFLKAVRSGSERPIPYEHLIGVTRATFAAVRALETGTKQVI